MEILFYCCRRRRRRRRGEHFLSLLFFISFAADAAWGAVDLWPSAHVRSRVIVVSGCVCFFLLRLLLLPLAAFVYYQMC